jgi:branched-chain amino acid transport system ATP-binding protein
MNSAPNAAPLLRVTGLTKRFGGIDAVHEVSFDLAAGQLLALIGPNGAGKTTCFNLLNGQLAADAGQVTLDGQALVGRAPHAVWRMGVGRTFQITATFASMTVRENVQMALASHHRELTRWWQPLAATHVAAADALLAQVGMQAHATRPCSVLAYGDLKRLELAVALAHGPKLLLMDEPTAGMAPQERIDLMALTAKLTRERAMAVLFTEHDMDVVFRHADRVLVLNRGVLLAQGTPGEVRANPEVQRIYLGSRSEH